VWEELVEDDYSYISFQQPWKTSAFEILPVFCKLKVKFKLYEINFQVLFFFSSKNEDMQQQIIKETFQLVSKRDDNVCNFLEGGR